jgi:hypothetical protein
MSSTYRYELRRGDVIVATGHLTSPMPLRAGESIEIGGQDGEVETIEPLRRDTSMRMVVRLSEQSRRS